MIYNPTSLGYVGSLRSFIENPFELNSIVKSTLLGIELECCLYYMLNIIPLC